MARRARRWRRRTRSRAGRRTRSPGSRIAARRRPPRKGGFDEQILPIYPAPRFSPIAADNGIRADTTLEALAALRPVFDRRFGTLTAGNSSPITDGGSAMVLTSEAVARRLHQKPLGYIRSWAWFALPPGGQLLQGPAYAAPLALERAGLKLSDIDLVETHEAFAAQVVSNMKAWPSRKFAAEELGRAEPMGEIDLDRWNVNWRLDRARPPLRRDRRARHDAAASRAGTPRPAVRSDHRLRRRRTRLRDGRRTRVKPRSPTQPRRPR
jgi:hypothetical protein